MRKMGMQWMEGSQLVADVPGEGGEGGAEVNEAVEGEGKEGGEVP